MIDKFYSVEYDPEDIYESGSLISGQQLVTDYKECNSEDYPILNELDTFDRLDIAVAFVADAWGLVLKES